jgi:hypothetical protein
LHTLIKNLCSIFITGNWTTLCDYIEMATKFDIDAFGCPICLEILFEPITMPCNHRMCKPCFAKNLELTNLHCPFCKKRIATWCRRAKNVDSLIDQKLWTRIQDDFANEIGKRMKGNGSTLFNEGGFSHDFSYEDGAIGKEFEEQIKQLRVEEELRRDRELVQSQKLINAIQLEEIGPAADAKDNTKDLISDFELASSSSASEVDSNFIDMQRKVEAQIEQNKKDEEMARQLQDQLGSEGVVTRHGASPRSSSAAKRPKGPRQMTLEETLGQRSKKRKLNS